MVRLAGGRMTPVELRTISQSYGKEKLASALGWSVRTLERRLSGQHMITKADELAIGAATNLGIPQQSP
jgi:hypothetical protein